jgi:hypothetical protein
VALGRVRESGRLLSAIRTASSLVRGSFFWASTDVGILPWGSTSTANEPQSGTKQCRPIQKCNDKSHYYLSRTLSSHIPAAMKAALVSTDPSVNFHVSSWNVIHSSNGKNTTMRTPMSLRTSPSISSLDFLSAEVGFTFVVVPRGQPGKVTIMPVNIKYASGTRSDI